jgi:aminoglycoside/choline kinase family phosphotransferase
VWIDFEDVFRGPLGWDVACLVAPGRMLGRDPRPSEAALAAYGHEPEALDVLVEARAVQVSVWTVALAERLPRIRDRIPGRMDWLRGLDDN